jgi:hypothetical protein
MDNIVHESEHLERVVAPSPSSWRRLSDEERGYWVRAGAAGILLSFPSVRLASLNRVPTARRLIRLKRKIVCGDRDTTQIHWSFIYPQ